MLSLGFMLAMILCCLEGIRAYALDDGWSLEHMNNCDDAKFIFAMKGNQQRRHHSVVEHQEKENEGEKFMERLGFTEEKEFLSKLEELTLMYRRKLDAGGL